MNNLTTYKWSISEWHKLVETGVLEGKPVELLEGEIIKVSPEGIEHFYTSDSVADYLRELLRGQAKIFEAHPITLDNSEPEPDLAIVRLPKTIYRKHLPYPQDIYWLIEVRPRADVRRLPSNGGKGTRTFEVSNKTLKIDLSQKAVTYARNKIPEYWVIDLKNKKLIVHTQPVEEKYAQIEEYQVGVVCPQAFPQVKIAVDQLLLF